MLKKTGRYTRLVHDWPPDPNEDWLSLVRDVGDKWHDAACRKAPAPDAIVTWWSMVAGASASDFRDGLNPELEVAMLGLCAAADEACAGVGVPWGDGSRSVDDFERECAILLVDKGTLCSRVEPSRIRVLPKLHTPQSGITLRSLTHHLALCPTGDVTMRWRIFPAGPQNARVLNLLLLPWPKRILPRQIREAGERPLRQWPDRYGFFEFDQDVDPGRVLQEAIGALKEAKNVVGTIHGIVMPELALTEAAHASLKQSLNTTLDRAFLIAGVARPGETKGAGDKVSRGFGRNYVSFDVPFASGVTSVQQDKHHRWKLDRGQILQYGIGNLAHDREWWEHIEVAQRDLAFVSMNSWLTMCVLICEDLARQDPIAEIVRSVGPNLLIALLMDGPQLASRWSARYATVLADDPGSSVLTLTSAGMAALSRPPGKPPSRVIALWKDPVRSEPVEITLPESYDGVVLTLSAEFREEFAADGRGDGKQAGSPILAGVHPIRVPLNRE